jgi:transposase
MISATTVVGIDVSRDWLDGFCFPGEQRFRLANSAEGRELLVAAIREMPGPVKIGFEATGGQEWVLWATLVAAGIDAGQLSPAQIKPLPFPRARGRRQTVSMPSSSRGSCSSDRMPVEGCRQRICVFSGL